ncbi:MAG: hypothetical protein GEU82_11675 [Luteitalea sp.]|nr:hypothetical protein [Luteitalea sp.]
MTAIVAILAAAYLLLPAAVRLVVRALTLTLNGCVWLAASLSSGADGWTIVVTIGSAAADALTTPQASGLIAALVVVGALALYGLQRLLGSEEEESR